MNIDTENASLVDAFLDGQKVGKLLLSPSLNPFQDGSKEYEAWARGHQGAVSVRLAGEIA